jgi:16S rRNA (adenine1518-N6/adenine1519-N6)-dimethyltransferase
VSDELTDRATVRRLLEEIGVRPSKRLGQSFLVDAGVVRSIEEAARAFSPERIVEIGSGLGAVTEALARLSAPVTAVEVDGRLAEHLRSVFARSSAVSVSHQDFLDYSFSGAEGKALVVGSIPYAITAPILQHLVECRDAISGAVLLTQREVEEKIAASPGASGLALGVLVRAYADVARIRLVGRRSFTPEPAVESALWTLRFRDVPRFTADAKAFFAVVRAIYGGRRKMLRSVLRDLAPTDVAAEALERAGIEPTVRGETLGFDGLDRLAKCLVAAKIGLGRAV